MSASDFWSRRKAAVEAEAAAEVSAEEAAHAAALEQELATRDDAEILADLGLREPEVLETPGEIRSFLAAAVPQRLRVRALRRLWRLNPALANLDGLVDYGEDFTDAATCVEHLQTVYQVGRGMIDRVTADAETLEVSKAEAEAEVTGPDAGTPQDDLATGDRPEDVAEAAAASPASDETLVVQAVAPIAAREAADLPPPAAGRMRFRFATG